MRPQKHLTFIVLTIILLSVLLVIINQLNQEPIKKILILGNSITYSEPKRGVGWFGSWGMAASRESLDWAHRVQHGIALQQGFPPELFTMSMDVPWVKDALPPAIEKMSDYQPDLVIIQMGDNANAVDEDEYPVEYRRVIEAVEAVDPRKVVLVSEWRGRLEANAYIKQLAQEYQAIYVDISSLRYEPANSAKAEGFENEQVGWHPGDTGMQAISDLVLQGIYESSFNKFLNR